MCDRLKKIFDMPAKKAFSLPINMFLGRMTSGVIQKERKNDNYEKETKYTPGNVDVFYSDWGCGAGQRS